MKGLSGHERDLVLIIDCGEKGEGYGHGYDKG